MKPTKVGLIGWGTIGDGTARVLIEDRDLLEKRLGWPVELVRIADLDITSPRSFPVDAGLLTTNASEILEDPEIDIVVELIGGYEPARKFILQALAAGKHVVTANKALLAVHGRELFEAAEKAGVDILFEASVGGGIPIIRSMKEGLAANNIEYLFGILNGTANYILTQMTEEGMDFHQALSLAQELGFAEADPTYDVEGVDTAHKLVLLTALSYGLRVDLDRVSVEGISKLDPLDIGFASEFGYVVKLLAISAREGDQVEARVHPAMLPKTHLLAGVGGPYNAINVKGGSVGDILLYGAGAGMMPTASAVVGDILELARGVKSNNPRRVPYLAWPKAAEEGPDLSLRPMDEVITKYYFRFSAYDRPGVLSKISGVLGSHGISIGSVIQKGRETAGSVPVVMLTHEAKEADVKAALSEIDRLDVVCDPTVLIRVEDRLR